MECLMRECPEISVVFSAAHVGARVALDGVIQVGELERVTQEEYRGCYITHKVLVVLLRIELDGKTADVTLGISSAKLSGYCREPGTKGLRFLSHIKRRFSPWYNG
jgi:hypothetical protein